MKASPARLKLLLEFWFDLLDEPTAADIRHKIATDTDWAEDYQKAQALAAKLRSGSQWFGPEELLQRPLPIPNRTAKVDSSILPDQSLADRAADNAVEPSPPSLALLQPGTPGGTATIPPAAKSSSRKSGRRLQWTDYLLLALAVVGLLVFPWSTAWQTAETAQLDDGLALHLEVFCPKQRFSGKPLPFYCRATDSQAQSVAATFACALVADNPTTVSPNSSQVTLVPKAFTTANSWMEIPAEQLPTHGHMAVTATGPKGQIQTLTVPVPPLAQPTKILAATLAEDQVGPVNWLAGTLPTTHEEKLPEQPVTLHLENDETKPAASEFYVRFLQPEDAAPYEWITPTEILAQLSVSNRAHLPDRRARHTVEGFHSDHADARSERLRRRETDAFYTKHEVEAIAQIKPDVAASALTAASFSLEPMPLSADLGAWSKSPLLPALQIQTNPLASRHSHRIRQDLTAMTNRWQFEPGATLYFRMLQLPTSVIDKENLDAAYRVSWRFQEQTLPLGILSAEQGLAVAACTLPDDLPTGTHTLQLEHLFTAAKCQIPIIVQPNLHTLNISEPKPWTVIAVPSLYNPYQQCSLYFNQQINSPKSPMSIDTECIESSTDSTAATAWFLAEQSRVTMEKAKHEPSKSAKVLAQSATRLPIEFARKSNQSQSQQLQLTCNATSPPTTAAVSLPTPLADRLSLTVVGVGGGLVPGVPNRCYWLAIDRRQNRPQPLTVSLVQRLSEDQVQWLADVQTDAWGAGHFDFVPAAGAVYELLRHFPDKSVLRQALPSSPSPANYAAGVGDQAHYPIPIPFTVVCDRLVLDETDSVHGTIHCQLSDESVASECLISCYDAENLIALESIPIQGPQTPFTLPLPPTNEGVLRLDYQLFTHCEAPVPVQSVRQLLYRSAESRLHADVTIKPLWQQSQFALQLRAGAKSDASGNFRHDTTGAGPYLWTVAVNETVAPTSVWWHDTEADLVPLLPLYQQFIAEPEPFDFARLAPYVKAQPRLQNLLNFALVWAQHLQTSDEMATTTVWHRHHLKKQSSPCPVTPAPNATDHWFYLITSLCILLAILNRRLVSISAIAFGVSIGFLFVYTTENNDSAATHLERSIAPSILDKPNFPEKQDVISETASATQQTQPALATAAESKPQPALLEFASQNYRPLFLCPVADLAAEPAPAGSTWQTRLWEPDATNEKASATWQVPLKYPAGLWNVHAQVYSANLDLQTCYLAGATPAPFAIELLVPGSLHVGDSLQGWLRLRNFSSDELEWQWEEPTATLCSSSNHIATAKPVFGCLCPDKATLVQPNQEKYIPVYLQAGTNAGTGMIYWQFRIKSRSATSPAAKRKAVGIDKPLATVSLPFTWKIQILAKQKLQAKVAAGVLYKDEQTTVPLPPLRGIENQKWQLLLFPHFWSELDYFIRHSNQWYDTAAGWRRAWGVAEQTAPVPALAKMELAAYWKIQQLLLAAADDAQQWTWPQLQAHCQNIDRLERLLFAVGAASVTPHAFSTKIAGLAADQEQLRQPLDYWLQQRQVAGAFSDSLSATGAILDLIHRKRQLSPPPRAHGTLVVTKEGESQPLFQQKVAPTQVATITHAFQLVRNDDHPAQSSALQLDWSGTAPLPFLLLASTDQCKEAEQRAPWGLHCDWGPTKLQVGVWTTVTIKLRNRSWQDQAPTLALGLPAGVVPCLRTLQDWQQRGRLRGWDWRRQQLMLFFHSIRAGTAMEYRLPVQALWAGQFHAPHATVGDTHTTVCRGGNWQIDH